MIKKSRLLPLLLAILLLSGCNTLAGKIIGYKELTRHDEKETTAFLNQSRNILDCTQIISTIDQTNAVLSLDTSETVFHDLYQPIHILCFDGDSLVSWMVQCYATKPGSLKIDWNHDGRFDQFPPRASVPVPFGHLSLPRFQHIYPTLQPTTRYTIIIIYTNMLQRASRRAVEALAHSIRGHETECAVTLINTDPWWAHLHNHPHDTPFHRDSSAQTTD